jgi:hypothetical protein
MISPNYRKTEPPADSERLWLSLSEQNDPQANNYRAKVLDSARPFSFNPQ